MEEKQQVIESLIEANDLLQEEVSRLRNSNRILRRVHSALRSANESLRRQVALAHENDTLFKQFCNGDFDAPSPGNVEGGLPEAKHEVEPLV
jgi:FtsZ-binding cell division protein ZapB